MNRISPIGLLLAVILAIVFFIFGMVQLAIRHFTKRAVFSSVSHSNRSLPDGSDPRIFEQQLQQLFRLHDSGLDQSLLDALPVFYYEEITGSKEPFDCAVCLGEFSDRDKLKLLPDCSHAFHIHCIETWLMSNSTCPLCRTSITDISLEKRDLSWPEKKSRITLEKGREAVFSVRLGKLRGLSRGQDQDEISSGNLDARRCYSMGAFQYVVGGNEEDLVKVKARYEVRRGNGDSLSVSKIWLWSKKGNFPSNTSGGNDERSGVFAENSNRFSLV